MSNLQAAIDFGELAQDVQDEGRYWGRDRLSIWGGWCCGEEDMMALLRDWPHCDAAMPYRIWEYTSNIAFEEGTLPSDKSRLERGRLFGPEGDLSLRRDRDRFYWHFVGPAGTQPPSGDFHVEDFWESAEAADTRFAQIEERSLLWGERRKGFDLWFEDRAGGARLEYPINELGRVQIRYQTFSRAGQVEFVWLTRLEVYNG